MIFFLEDEQSIRKLVVYTLENSGFSAKGFASANEFWEAMKSEIPDLVMLDIMLPDEDGIEVLKKLRKSSITSKLPVIMLTAKSTEYDKVLALDLGADDYLPKPFGMMELIARVRSLLRRTGAPNFEEKEFRIDGLYISIPRHLVTIDGEPINLTLKEFDVLAYLIRNPDIVLTRDQITNVVWGYYYNGESRTVDVHIRTLRSKLGKYESIIETVRGVGYRIGGQK